MRWPRGTVALHPAGLLGSNFVSSARRLLYCSSVPFSLYGSTHGSMKSVAAQLKSDWVFIRRRRMESPPPDRTEGEQAVSAEGDDSNDNNNAAMKCFDHWSSDMNGCTAEEFLQGAKQSYRSLGVLLETLREAASHNGPTGRPVAREVALAKLQGLLLKNYSVKEDIVGEAVISSEKGSAKGTDAFHKTVSKALKQVLPLSQGLSEHLSEMWDKQRTLDFNIFDIAAPDDYVIDADMKLFNPFLVKSSDDLLEYAAWKKNGEECPKPVSVDATTGGACSSPPLKCSFSSGKLDPEKVGERETWSIGCLQRVLKPAPKLMPIAFVSLDVVMPPQRYCEAFDWFYQRTCGYSSEYERVEAARLYTSPSFFLGIFRQCLFLVDFVKRMFVGRPLQLDCTRLVQKLHGNSVDIRRSPPAVRKLLCFYMEGDGRWTLFDVFILERVLVPVSPTASSK